MSVIVEFTKSPRIKPILVCMAAAILFLPGASAARKKKKQSSGPADTALAQYIARVKAASIESPTTPGSLWTPQARWANLGIDDKARKVGDIVTILLADSYSSSTTGTVKSQRTLNSSAGISALLGNLGANNSLQNLFTPNSSTNLNGTGQSSVSSSLDVTLAGQVVDVLPNGALIIQAARDMNVGNERQTIVVRGVLRPEDISPLDIASSASLANLEVEVKGKGVVSEGTRPPNIVIRTLLKLLSF